MISPPLPRFAFLVRVKECIEALERLMLEV
jgi:hypothetical protein